MLREKSSMAQFKALVCVAVFLLFCFLVHSLCVPKPQHLWEIRPSCQHFDLIVEYVNQVVARWTKSNSSHSLFQFPLSSFAGGLALTVRAAHSGLKLTSASDLCSVCTGKLHMKALTYSKQLVGVGFDFSAPSRTFLHGRVAWQLWDYTSLFNIQDANSFRTEC